MTRARTAVVLAVLAVIAVGATVGVAVATREPETETSGHLPPAAVQSVVDAASGARLDVPADDWTVRGQRARIYYADAHGRPAVVVRGPAVLRAGYCGAQPHGSYRAFAGFTRQPFDAWVTAIGGPAERSTDGEIQRATLQPDASGPCAAAEVELAMRSTGGVHVVVVADAGALDDDEVDAVLASLELAEPDVAH
ncbi:hypothetical protein [Nocardioides mangrovi]|uniref:DUF8017 domain-containing protein n=1 Tax=Nocardioides mangrovi TaxID=2874580 RepID=A0ABS7UFT7_9ACTN|nr:hypothetical protein [Nocardioides mangrovi]MBZ5739694.1 hypothetical protein [Nocardioides mangrovi]